VSVGNTGLEEVVAILEEEGLHSLSMGVMGRKEDWSADAPLISFR
jgi:hypothetical protein